MSTAYGYHTPIGQHQNSSALINHYGSNVNYHSAGESYRPYAYRIDPVQPVDYSGHVNPLTNQPIEPRCSGLTLDSPTNNNNNNAKMSIQSMNNDQTGSPPAKRRALTRLQPLSIPDHHQDTSSDELLPSEHNFPSATTNGDGGPITMLTTTVLPLRYSHAHIKASVGEPTDLIDQWNPSPPWSETTQKVPDAQQELCYLSRTPPTPTSAPLSSNGVAFSFDWMPEQFVPIVDSSHSGGSLSQSPPQSMSSITPVNDHKFYIVHNLDRSPEEHFTNRKQS